MISKISHFFLWFIVWLLLSWPPDSRDIITGILVSIFVSVMTFDIFSSLYSSEQARAASRKGIGYNMARIFWLICYLFVFLWECLKANIDVAYRVIHPDVPISPGTIKAKTSLKSDIGLTFLANSLTLTPGRTTVDIDKDNGYIYLHILNLRGRTDEHKTVLAKYENILRRIFE